MAKRDRNEKRERKQQRCVAELEREIVELRAALAIAKNENAVLNELLTAQRHCIAATESRNVLAAMMSRNDAEQYRRATDQPPDQP